MNLAAFLDLGVPESHLRAELARLPIQSEYDIEVRSDAKMGISGTHVKVHAQDTDDHRHHATIVKMIKHARYPTGTEQRALAIFQAIAVAEGKIHNVPPERVHFHEVGAVDSIIDIIGAAIAIEYVNPDIILCNPVELGGGFVDCAHGRFPVPAPATQELLVGAPCTYGGVDGEATTPTGAAILGVSVDEFSPSGRFTPNKVGYGIGFKDFVIPNVVRVALGEYVPHQPARAAIGHVNIEANIDDMSPEAYEPLMQTLFAAGAVDVFITPIIMKKSRPAHIVSALCETAQQHAVSDALLNHSTTIGLRIIPFEKRMLPRDVVRMETSLGTISVKCVIQPDGRKRGKAEHDEVLAIAASQGMDYGEASSLIAAEIRLQFNA